MSNGSTIVVAAVIINIFLILNNKYIYIVYTGLEPETRSDNIKTTF